MRQRVLLPALLGVLLLVPGAAGAAERPAPRVIGGQPATEAAWPFAVAIRTALGGQFCAGTLIRPQWVLTAGHCKLYDTRSLRVVAGTVDLRSGTGTVVGVERQVRHPDYRQPVPGAPRDDFMLLRLHAPLAQATIPLAEANPPTGTTLRVAGWGATSYNAATDAIGPSSAILRDASVRLRAGSTCRDAFGREVFIPGEMLCAAGPGRDACAGDSGGPLVRGEGDEARLVGVVSWGTGCALPRYPGVYGSAAEAACWVDGVVDPPAPPRAIALAETSGGLIVDWAWRPPCADAVRPTAFRVRASTGAVVEVAGTEASAELTGLADGVPVEVAVTAVNANGESAAIVAAGTPGPPLAAVETAAWTGYRAATLRVAVPAHAEPLDLRVETGQDLAFVARSPIGLAPDPAAAVLDVVVPGLPLGRAVQVRIAASLPARGTTTAAFVLVEPLPPRALRRPVVRGVPLVGRAVRCAAGRWTGTRPFEVRRSWLRGGRVIPGETASTLRLTSADRGRAIACRLRVSAPGGRTTAQSAPVRVG